MADGHRRANGAVWVWQAWHNLRATSGAIGRALRYVSLKQMWQLALLTAHDAALGTCRISRPPAYAP